MKSMVSEDSTSNGRDGSWSCFRETEDEMAGYSDYVVDAVGRLELCFL